MNRNNEKDQFMNAINYLLEHEENGNNITYINQLDLDHNLKLCLKNMAVLLPNSKVDNIKQISSSKEENEIIRKISHEVFNHSRDITEQLNNDPINFDYLDALKKGQELKYYIAKEIRHYA